MSERDPAVAKLDTAPRYWCFISYRHADNREQDRAWASWLHGELERYDVPPALVGKKNARGDVIPARIYPVFRDEQSQAANSDLGRAIADALDSSRFLVVLCSPRAAESRYVADEIHHFKRTNRADRIIAAIIDGEPGDPERECFPEPLRHPLLPDGTLDTSTAESPIAADFRVSDGESTGQGYTSVQAYYRRFREDGNVSRREARKRADAYDDRLQLMKLKVIAGILGVTLEELRDRDQVHQLQLARRRTRVLRRWMFVVTAMGALAAGLGLVAEARRKEARTAQVRSVRSAAVRLIAQDESTRGLAYLAASLRLDPDDPRTIARTVTLLSERTFALPISDEKRYVQMPRDRDIESRMTGARSSDGTMEALDLRAEPGGEKAYLVFSPTGKRPEARFPLPFEDPYGTEWRSQFDDRGNWLAILATSRSGTEARVWRSDSAGLAPAIEPMRIAEQVGGRMVLSAPSGKGSTPSAVVLRTLEIQRDDRENASTLWDLADGRYTPEWRESRSIPEAHLEERNDTAALRKRVAAIGWKLEDSGDESPYQLVDPRGTGFHLGHDAYANTYAIDISDRVRIVATGGEDGVARIWRRNRSTVRPGPTMLHPEPVWLVRLSGDGRLLLTATGSPSDMVTSTVRLWDADTGELLAGPWATIGRARACTIAEDGSAVQCVVNAMPPHLPIGVAAWPIGGSRSREEVLELADLAEAVAGWRLTAEGGLVSVPTAERMAILERCRAVVQRADAGPLRRFVGWFLADRATRRSLFAAPDDPREPRA
ncbi:MAG: TIR domain-containing protein [Longimicrobiaceae bacterium]